MRTYIPCSPDVLLNSPFNGAGTRGESVRGSFGTTHTVRHSGQPSLEDFVLALQFCSYNFFIEFLVEKVVKMEVLDEYGQTPLGIAGAVITVGVKDHYYQSSRVVGKSTADCC